MPGSGYYCSHYDGEGNQDSGGRQHFWGVGGGRTRTGFQSCFFQSPRLLISPYCFRGNTSGQLLIGTLCREPLRILPEGYLPKMVRDDVVGPFGLWRRPTTLSSPSLKQTFIHLCAKAHICMYTLVPRSLNQFHYKPLDSSFVMYFSPQGCSWDSLIKIKKKKKVHEFHLKPFTSTKYCWGGSRDGSKTKRTEWLPLAPWSLPPWGHASNCLPWSLRLIFLHLI